MFLRLFLLGACVLCIMPRAAQAVEKSYALETTQVRNDWEDNGKPNLAQAWKDFQDLVGPLQLELTSTFYGQIWSDSEVGGDSQIGEAILGWDNRFMATWNPWEDGELFLQLQYIFGKDDKTPDGKGVVLSGMNNITGGLPEGKFYFHDMTFTQQLFERALYVALGHTDPEAYLDVNRFANSETTQFSAQLFVNEVGLDNVDERGPMVAMGLQPHEMVEITAMISSTTRPGTPDSGKNLWTRPFWDAPFVGGQVNLMPRLFDREGNYRFFGWATLYEQPHNDADGESCNWGLGFNFDQDLGKNLGVFGRLGYADEQVNAVSWNWSAGMQYTGLIPGRDDDIAALALGGAQAAPNVEYGGMELHLEAYYKVMLTDWLALTPDFQYVVQPSGDPDATPVVQGMLRVELDLQS